MTGASVAVTPGCNSASEYTSRAGVGKSSTCCWFSVVTSRPSSVSTSDALSETSTLAVTLPAANLTSARDVTLGATVTPSTLDAPNPSCVAVAR